MLNASRLPTGRRGQALAVALLVLVLALGWQAVGAPLLDWYGERADALERRSLLARRMAQIAGELPRREAEAKAQGAAGPARVPVLPGGSDALAGAALQEMVQGMAARTGATVSSTEALTPRQEGAYRIVGVRLSVSAPWPNLIRLLLAVEEWSPPLLIDDLQVHGARGLVREGGGNGPVQAGFAVIGFRAGTGGS